MVPLSELVASLICVLRDWISLLVSSALQFSPDSLPLPLPLPVESVPVLLELRVGAAQVGVAADSSANTVIARTKSHFPKAIVFVLF